MGDVLTPSGVDASSLGREPDADPNRQGRQLPLCALLLRQGVALSAVFEGAEPQEWTWYRVARVDVDHRSVEVTASDGPVDEFGLQVGVRRRRGSTPNWRTLLRESGVDVTVTDTEQESAVIVVRTSTTPARIVLWCYGGLSRSIPRACTDNRFGLVVALNKHAAGAQLTPWRTPPPDLPRRRVVGDPSARVRGTVHQVRDGYPHRATSSSAGPAPLDGLRFDDLSDLLHSLSLRTQDELMSDLEGGRTLKFSTYVESLHDFATLADHLVTLRARTDYQQEWDWIDRFVPVDDNAEADEVLHELFDRLVGPEDVRADLLMPPLPADDDTVGRVVKYCMPGERGLHGQALTMRAFRAWLQRQADRPGAELLRKNARFALEGHERDGLVEIPLHELLVAELDVAGTSYVLSDGEVLRVDTAFLHALDQRINATIPWSDFPFPTFEGGTEPAYLANAYEDSGRRLLLVDDDPIRLPGETPFEVCDLLTDDRRLVFAKLKGRSSLFSHLATQVETSAEVLSRSPEARAAFLNTIRRLTADPALLDSAERIAAALAAHRPDEVTLTLLLLGSWKERTLSALPLVSRLRLRRTAQKIAALGYRLEIAAPDQHHGHLPPRQRR